MAETTNQAWRGGNVVEIARTFQLFRNHGPACVRLAGWPDGRRLAVYLGVDLEHFAFGEAKGAELAPGGPQPDVSNCNWRDYGNRVGAWRPIDTLAALGMPARVLANSAMCDHAPALLDVHPARGDEIAGHGRTNSERQGDMAEAEERALIRETTDRLSAHSGGPMGGWPSP